MSPMGAAVRTPHISHCLSCYRTHKIPKFPFCVSLLSLQYLGGSREGGSTSSKANNTRKWSHELKPDYLAL